MEKGLNIRSDGTFLLGDVRYRAMVETKDGRVMQAKEDARIRRIVKAHLTQGKQVGQPLAYHTFAAKSNLPPAGIERKRGSQTCYAASLLQYLATPRFADEMRNERPNLATLIDHILQARKTGRPVPSEEIEDFLSDLGISPKDQRDPVELFGLLGLSGLDEETHHPTFFYHLPVGRNHEPSVGRSIIKANHLERIAKELPESLHLYLDRTTDEMEISERDVEVNPEIRVVLHDGRLAVYALERAISHTGGNQGDGHYVNYERTAQGYQQINDASISSRTFEETIREMRTTATVVQYRLKRIVNADRVSRPIASPVALPHTLEPKLAEEQYRPLEYARHLAAKRSETFSSVASQFVLDANRGADCYWIENAKGQFERLIPRHVTLLDMAQQALAIGRLRELLREKGSEFIAEASGFLNQSITGIPFDNLMPLDGSEFWGKIKDEHLKEGETFALFFHRNGDIDLHQVMQMALTPQDFRENPKFVWVHYHYDRESDEATFHYSDRLDEPPALILPSS